MPWAFALSPLWEIHREQFSCQRHRRALREQQFVTVTAQNAAGEGRSSSDMQRPPPGPQGCSCQARGREVWEPQPSPQEVPSTHERQQKAKRIAKRDCSNH